MANSLSGIFAKVWPLILVLCIVVNVLPLLQRIANDFFHWIFLAFSKVQFMTKGMQLFILLPFLMMFWCSHNLINFSLNIHIIKVSMCSFTKNGCKMS